MNDAMLTATLTAAGAKTGDKGIASLPDGRALTLYAAHAGVPLTISKIEKVQLIEGIVHATNGKGEIFLVAQDDVFATAIDGGTAAAAARKAGFLG